MKRIKIEYKISVSPARNVCGYHDSGEFVKKFRVSANKGGKEIGAAEGYILNMSKMMEYDRLILLDYTATTESLFSSLYHSTPLDADMASISKGFKPECLSALNEHFGCDFDSIDDDDDAWLGHYGITIGFVDSVDVEKEYRGMGIGSKMMNMLKRFRNTVDFMFLQSYPGETQEKVRELKLTNEEEDVFFNSDACKKKYAEGQLKVDRFYDKLGYKSFNANGSVWMVIDKSGLRNLEKESRKSMDDRFPNPF